METQDLAGSDASSDAGPDAQVRLRILFFVHQLGKTRHFDGVLERLTKRGHGVVLAAAGKKGGFKGSTKTLANGRRVEVVTCPARRVDRWKTLAPTLRLTRDYLRFFEPSHAHALKLAARASSYVPDAVRGLVESRPWMQRHARALGRVLAAAEAALPPERYFELFIKYHEPDLVLVTPLVDFGSYQTDYVKAAHRLGIPVAFLPFSWDNLTNRGLIRVQPDRVLVWNEIQKREAVELHRVAASRVVVVGAARFDEFFDLRPSTTRQEFCAAVGLDPARPLLLYGCSSPFIAPREVEFVRRWIGEIRQSGDPALAGASVLVRPHPVHTDQWENVSFADLPDVAIWRLPTSMNADQGLYDSLHHSAALIGLNTSAMLEASIAERAVCTVLAPEFTGGQEQTLHFHYLREENGGPVRVARDFEQHRQHLAEIVRDPAAAEQRAKKFVRKFLRPQGRTQRVDRIMVRELEQLALAGKRPRRVAPAWQYPVRWALRLVPGAR
jgi:hypothetical protein